MKDTRDLLSEFTSARYPIQTGSGCIRNKFGAGRRADLVGHHIEPVLLPGKAYDSMNEIRATRRIYPTGAENQVPAAAFL